MTTIDKLIPGGRGLSQVLLRRAPTVGVDADAATRPQFEATDSSGRALCIKLPEGTHLRSGDVLVACDGSLAVVQVTGEAGLGEGGCGHDDHAERHHHGRHCGHDHGHACGHEHGRGGHEHGQCGHGHGHPHEHAQTGSR